MNEQDGALVARAATIINANHGDQWTGDGEFEDTARQIIAMLAASPTNKEPSDADVERVAWLIEWPATRQYPLRFWAAGEPYVINANDATRFARKDDAEAVIKDQKLTQGDAVAVEHIWIDAARAAITTMQRDTP